MHGLPALLAQINLVDVRLKADQGLTTIDAGIVPGGGSGHVARKWIAIDDFVTGTGRSKVTLDEKHLLDRDR